MKLLIVVGLVGAVFIACLRLSNPLPDYHCVEWGDEKLVTRVYQKWQLWYKARPCTKLRFEEQRKAP